MSFGEKVARAKAAQEARPKHKDVPVSFDSDLVEERSRVLEELGELHQQREEIIGQAAGVLTLKPNTAAIDRKLNRLAKRLQQIDALDQENLVTVRLYRLGGDDWVDLVAGHPARLNSAIDRGVGYNVNTGTLAALISHGRTVEGDVEETHTQEEWIAFAEILAGGEFIKLVNGVYELNVTDAVHRTAALKNSFEAALASAKK